MTTPPDDPRADEGLASLLLWAAVMSHRQEADVLDRVRLSIGKDDTEAWNALIFAAFFLRVEASTHEAALTAARSHRGM